MINDTINLLKIRQQGDVFLNFNHIISITDYDDKTTIKMSNGDVYVVDDPCGHISSEIEGRKDIEVIDPFDFDYD